MKRLRKSSPRTDGPEALVQEDERPLVRVSGVLHRFEPPAADLEVEIDASAQGAAPEDDVSATPR